jgi:phage tail-like protein
MGTLSDQPLFFTGSNFYLDLKLDGSNDFVDGIFLECQGFDYSQDLIEFSEVTSGRWGEARSKGKFVRTKLPGNAKGGNLTLCRGMTSSMALWNWFEATQDSKWAKQRRDALLTIYEEGTPQARFELKAAWPTRYKFSDVKSRSAQLEVEEVEIAYEGFKRVKV